MAPLLRLFAPVLLFGLATGAVAAQASPPAAGEEVPDAPSAQAQPPVIEPTGPTAILDTSMGRISCRLFDKEAPIATANFIALAEGARDWINPETRRKMHGSPLYNGTIFHRVIPGFMIQGGDPEGDGMGDPGYTFKDEFDPNLNFDVPGRLAMANSGPNTNGSQFFITEAPHPSLDQKYTIFGQCDPASLPVIQAIARVPRGERNRPLQPVILEKVTIVPVGETPPPEPSARPSTKQESEPVVPPGF